MRLPQRKILWIWCAYSNSASLLVWCADLPMALIHLSRWNGWGCSIICFGTSRWTLVYSSNQYIYLLCHHVALLAWSAQPEMRRKVCKIILSVHSAVSQRFYIWTMSYNLVRGYLYAPNTCLYSIIRYLHLVRSAFDVTQYAYSNIFTNSVENNTRIC